MTTLTLAAVARWRPGSLVAAADELVATAASVGEAAAACRRSLGDAVDDAGGAWATTARGRADQEARRGEALADALTGAAVALRTGAAALARARDTLLRAVDRAQAAGFGVTPDGGVVLPEQPSPPPDAAPLDQLAWRVAPAQVEAALVVEERRAAHEGTIAGALAGAAAADLTLADAVAGLEVPETLPSMVTAFQARTELLGDPVAALGAAGGLVVAARAANDGRSLISRGRLLHDYASLVGRTAPPSAIEKARQAFASGTASNPVLKVLGRASLPLTVVTGVQDVATGGVHDGARGWATRGFGAAGVVGAGMVMTAATPALVVVGGTAVLAYGAWSAGNEVVDHWDQVEDSAGAVGEWVVDVAGDRAVETAVALEWAGETLAAAEAGTLDALGDLF